MPCGTKLRSNNNAKSNLTLTPDNLEYKYTVEQEIAVKPH